MPNTYTQLYVQLVFAVQGRQSLISKSWKDELYKYITGIVHHKGARIMQINGMPDHIHIFAGFNPDQTISQLVKEIKVSSGLWINDTHRPVGKFHWQEGFGGFTYSKSQVQDVCHYIENQESHHKKLSFKEEYLAFLKGFGVEYNEKYLFEFIDDPYSTPTES